VLIFAHKEKRITDLAARFPARQYVLIDDKPKVLQACKEALGARLTTVLVRFGHYALAPDAGDGGADIKIDGPAELLGRTAADFMQTPAAATRS
jgi:hypothetical protein